MFFFQNSKLGIVSWYQLTNFTEHLLQAKHHAKNFIFIGGGKWKRARNKDKPILAFVTGCDHWHIRTHRNMRANLMEDDEFWFVLWDVGLDMTAGRDKMVILTMSL